jgi:hypothetical protein
LGRFEDGKTGLDGGIIDLPAYYIGKAQFTFTTNNGAIIITGYTGLEGAVTIPSTINGYPATRIGGLMKSRGNYPPLPKICFCWTNGLIRVRIAYWPVERCCEHPGGVLKESVGWQLVTHGIINIKLNNNRNGFSLLKKTVSVLQPVRNSPIIG